MSLSNGNRDNLALSVDITYNTDPMNPHIPAVLVKWVRFAGGETI